MSKCSIPEVVAMADRLMMDLSLPEKSELRGAVVLIAAVSQCVGGERDGRYQGFSVLDVVPRKDGDVDISAEEYLVLMHKTMDAIGKLGKFMCGREGNEDIPTALRKLECISGLFSSVRAMALSLGFPDAKTFAEVAMSSASLLEAYGKDPKKMGPAVLQIFHDK